MNSAFNQIDSLQRTINEQILPDKHLLQQIKEYYRIGLTYTSNALEGNSLTETETKIVLEEGITIGGKRLVDHLEAVGHSDAYDFLLSLPHTQNFTEATILKLHKLFYYRIDESNAGTYRKVKVFLSGSKYPMPEPSQVPHLMQQFIAHYGPELSSKHPVEFAALVHKEFVFIHPFVDGNGRVARLLMNLVLLSSGYPLAIIPPITRPEYIASLEKAHIND